MTTVQNWFNEFKRGHTLVFDEPHPGSPKAATKEDNMKISSRFHIDRLPVEGA